MEIAQEALDKIIDEIKHIHADSMENLLRASDGQIKQVKEHYDEKVEELTRQNDGLLGAVGRLQAERDSAVKDLEQQKLRERERDEDIKRTCFDIDRENQLERQKIKEEISGYKREIADLQAKLKKQGKR